MEHNPWDLGGGNSSQYQPSNTIQNEFSDRDAVFVKKYPNLCSVPNISLFTSAMQGGNGAINITELADEVMFLANSYVQVERKLLQYKNDYDLLLEKNQELKDAVAKDKKLKNVTNPNSDVQSQQQNSGLQQNIQHLEQQVASSSQLQQQNNALQQQSKNLEQQLNLAQ